MLHLGKKKTKPRQKSLTSQSKTYC